MVCSILLHIVPLPLSPCPGLLQGRVSRRYRPQDIVAKSNFTLVLTPTSPLTLLTFPTNMEFCRNKIRTWSTNSLSLEILQFHVSHFLHPLQRKHKYKLISTTATVHYCPSLYFIVHHCNYPLLSTPTTVHYELSTTDCPLLSTTDHNHCPLLSTCPPLSNSVHHCPTVS